MNKKIPLEVEYVLRRLPVELIEGIYNLSLDEKRVKYINALLDLLTQQEGNSIISTAGSAQTQDDLLKNAMAHSFARGRISFAVLLSNIIKYSGDVAEKKTEKAKKNGR